MRSQKTIFLLKIFQLKELIQQHKPFLLFLVKFLLFYGLTVFSYQMYLNQYSAEKFETDGITQHVSIQTSNVIKYSGVYSKTYPHEMQPCYKLFYKEKYIARIVEGCNAISVILLFASFVFAFSSKILKTTLFIVFGSILIYVLNIFRIALLAQGLYYYPEYEHLLHDIVFPLVIYGIVIILWLLWIFKFSGYVVKPAK